MSPGDDRGPGAANPGATTDQTEGLPATLSTAECTDVHSISTDAAHGYARQGWSVVPVHHLVGDATCSCRKRAACPSTAKHPIFDKWGEKATTSGADIAEIWLAHPDANVGIATGSRSGVWVLDVDDLGAWVALLDGRAEPETYTVQTGSGGRHYYFTLPDFAVPTTKGKPAAGLDLRGEGGMVVAPPSVSAKGPYEVLHDLPIAEAPGWLLDLVRGASRKPALLVVESEHTGTPTVRGDAYARAAVDNVLTGLDELPRPWRDGAGWDSGTFNAACTLVEFANSGWNSYTLTGARRDLFAHAPRDEAWGSVRQGGQRSDHEVKFDSAVQTVGGVGRALPALTARESAPFAGTAPTATGVDDTPAEGKAGVKTASVATQLIELAQMTYRFGVSTKAEPFAVPLAGSNVARMLRGAGGSLRSELGAAYFTEHSKAAPQQALADAVATLEGFAQQSEPELLHLRSAAVGGVVWVDLGDSAGRVLQIAAHGWQVVDHAPVLFTRTALTAALPEPERGGQLDELWDLLNVTVEDQPLVLAWQLAALLTPDLPCPVLALLGEQGTGKTTASKRLAALVDPAYPQVRRSPKDGEAWVSAATGSRVVALDNVSAVPEWFSDALCRAVTGDGDVRRRLYSDGDLHVIAFRRAVIVNGIDLGAVRDDLAERLLTVQLARITEDHRSRESDLEQRWEVAHPRVLGALLDLAVQVLAQREGCLPETLPRMADFAHTLATVDRALGTTGLTRYRQQAGEMAADAVDSDLVLKAITTHVTEHFVGTGAELLALITDHDVKTQPRGWPTTAKAMTGELKRKAPALRRLGWIVDDLGRGGEHKVLRWRLTPPHDTGMTRASHGHHGHETGIEETPCPSGAPPLTCEDTKTGSETGMTGMQPPFSLCSAIEGDKREEPSPPERVWPDSMPVMPVDDCPGCGRRLLDPRSVDRGVCTACLLAGAA